MKRQQNGAVLVMVAILIVVMIGVAALALDVGRLLVLRSEMNNAVDAAALAAAAELNGSAGAQLRAKQAAISLIQHDSHFAKVRELLSTSLVEDSDIHFSFFCAIENDASASNVSNECKNSDVGTGVDANKHIAVDDEDTHYIRVTLNPEVTQGNDQPRYSIDLFFLPALGALGINVPAEASTTATALAGRSYIICDYPPLMICNPCENMPNGACTSDEELNPGDQVRLYMGATNGSWVPGDFGLLVPPGGNSGAADVGEFLAGSDMGCSDPVISTDPGGKVQQIKWGLNTRFGIYGHKYTFSDYPSSPDVLDYPRDSNLISNPAERIGNGQWKPPTGYWNDYVHSTATDPVLSKRYDYYMWESANNDLPYMKTKPAATCDPITNDKQCPSGAVIWNGKPSKTTSASTDRRVITVPVLNCKSLSIKGSTPDIWVSKEEYWKKFFITEHVDDPSGSPIIYAEYIGNVNDNEGTLRVEVKLYE